jgi:hypothetical protein
VDLLSFGDALERISLSQSSGLSRPYNETYNTADCGKIDINVFTGALLFILAFDLSVPGLNPFTGQSLCNFKHVANGC